MGVLGVIERFEGRSFNQNLDKYRRQYVRHYTAYCDSANLDWNTVTAASGLPVVGTDVYPTDSGALCVGVSGTQRQKFFELTYTYDSDVPITQLQNKNPLLRQPIFKLDNQKFQKPMYQDLNGTAVINSAKQPFENVVEIDATFPVLTIEKNYTTFAIAQVRTLQNSINNADWSVTLPDASTLTIPQYCGKMDSITIEERVENEQTYYSYVFKILINPDVPWQPYKVLDCGYAQLSGDGLSIIGIKDKYGQDVSKPVPLDGSGHAMTLPITPGTEHYISFTMYRAVSWAGIP